MGKLSSTVVRLFKCRVGVILFCSVTTMLSQAQTFTFNFTNGSTPTDSLIQGVDGNLYGTTYAGGNGFGEGTAFKITAAGSLTTLYNFCSLGG